MYSAGQGRQNQNDLAAHGVAEYLGRALKTAHDGGGHADFDPRLGNGRLGLGKGGPLSQIEGNGHGGELALMRHGERREGRAHAGHAEQRHQAVLARQAHLVQSLRAFQPVRPVFQHHAVLVFVLVDGGHLALPEGIVQGRVHIPHGQAQAGQSVAVHREHGLEAALLNVAVHVLEQGQGRQGLLEAGGPRCADRPDCRPAGYTGTGSARCARPS